ncbi:transcriptional regulator [Streptomyces xanthochromogenes]|uniref:transcriptional regulator n=1 Tax=Streptomyces xanthochromogenes TaxID=67384 RepID=UPI003794DD8C
MDAGGRRIGADGAGGQHPVRHGPRPYVRRRAHAGTLGLSFPPGTAGSLRPAEHHGHEEAAGGGATTGASASQGAAFDAAFRHPTRLTVAAFLSACDEAEFATVRDYCQVSDSVLSKAASALEAAGYLGIRKGAAGKRFRTWLCLTDDGRDALARHLEALQALASAVRDAGAARAESEPSRSAAQPNA